MTTSGFCWRDRPTLVTGATGLLGGWLVKRLFEESADIVSLVRDWVPQSEVIRANLLEEVKVVRGDVRDQALLERILGEYEIKTVFHLAAQTIVGIANRNPISTFETNVSGTWSLLEACRRSPTVTEIIVASSDKAYGEADELPYTEETPLHGQHPYDVSKACADLIVQCYAKTYALNACATRCGNLFGGGDLNWNRIVPGTIRSILRNEIPVIRSDGRSIRDYFSAEDAASAYLLLAEHLSLNPSLKGEVFNFSYGKPVTVLEITEKILKLMQASFTPHILNQAPHEIQKQYLNSGKAEEKLGWKPLYGFDQALKRTVDWYKDFFGVKP